MTLEKLQDLIYSAGIVGAGGAGFPTHKKLSMQVEDIVVNAAECEPLMMVDHHILEKHFGDVVDVLKVISDTLNAKRVIIGIKSKNIHLLDKKIVNSLKGTNISIKEIPDVYPAGDEVVLTYETTGKIVPEGAIPIAVGVMVVNAETLYNIHKAFKGENVTEKYITIGGDIDKDITVKAPIGMKISELLADCKITDLTDREVINGGPMMGKLVDLENDVVTKTTKGLLIFPKTHSVIQRKKQDISITLKRASAACCNCTMCTDLCPRHLLGYDLQVHKTVRAASHSEVTNTEAFLQNSLCCGCGICTVIACQQMLDPQKIATTIKGSLGKHGLKRENNKAPQKVNDMRSSRLVSSQTLIDRLGIRKYVKSEVNREYITFNPTTVYIELSQHVGKKADSLVKVGDAVVKGQPIAATSADALGTTMHSSINGVVREVNDRFIIISK
ncbi:MAG: 4Fe-4S dicluster domain-containing protein [Clostridia bacterium]|nr:4Fe-4S dicluster domain-containing protein [Clostridia bacterium]